LFAVSCATPPDIQLTADPVALDDDYCKPFLDDEASYFTEDDVAEAQFEFDMAKREARIEKADTDFYLQDAGQDVQEAEHELLVFTSADKPFQIANSEHDLLSLRNNLLESKEELAQLEMLYGADELDDKTAEIVLQRARRQLSWTLTYLELEEHTHAQLIQVLLPAERRVYERTLEMAKHEYGAAKARAEIEMLRTNRALEIQARELAELKAELDEE